MAGGGISMRAPSASSTSALPQREDIARLPCLATTTPQPAATKAAAVLTLKVSAASPPVPTTSMIRSMPGTTMRTTFSRRARTKPVISSGVSPFMRSAVNSAAIWESGTPSPDMTALRAA